MELISLSQIVSIVNAARTADNTVRKQGKSKLLYCYNNHPNQTVEHFIHLICMNEDEAARLIADSGLGQQTQPTLLKRFICVQLQNLVTIKNNQSIYPYIWERLRSEVQKDLKQKLFLFLQQNSSVHIQPLIRKITRLIGCLAADLIHQKNASLWPQFPNMVFKFMQEDIKYAFYILESFFEEKPERFKEIIDNIGDIFQHVLDQQQEPSLILPALLCFDSYLKVTTEQKTTEKIKFSGEKVINAIRTYHSQQYTQCQHQCVLVLLKIMLKNHPKFFQKDFKFILTFFKDFLSQKQKPDQQHKDIVSETLVDYCESSPIVFQQNSRNLQILLELVISHMLPKEINIEEEWMQPPQGFDLKKTDNNFDRNNRTALNNIVRVMRSIGSNRVLEPIENIVNDMFANKEQREYWHYYGLMILSQLGKFFNNIEDIKKYITIIVQDLKHENHLLRHAALHVFGQFADDFRSSFVNKYGEFVYLMLVSMLSTEEVPRVRAHILAALANLFKNLKFTTTIVSIVSDYKKTVKKILQIAQSEISIVKQNAFVTISGFIQLTGISFKNFLQNYFRMFFQLFGSGNYNRFEYNNLKGLALETTGYVLSNVGAHYFRPYLDGVLPILEGFQEMTYRTPLFKNILKLSKHLCTQYKQQLTPVITKILPSLLETITNNIRQAIATCQYLEDEYNSKMQSQRLGIDNYQAIENYETEEVIAGVQAVTTFSQYIPFVFQKYYDQIMQIFIMILEKYPNTKVQNETVVQIPKLILLISDEILQQYTAKCFIFLIIQLLQSQNETQITPQKFKSINNILSTIPSKIFSLPQQLEVFNKIFLNQLNQSYIRQQLMTYSRDANKNKSAEVRLDFLDQDEIQELISDIFGTVMRIYNIQAFQIAKFLVENVVIILINDENNSNRIKVGLYILSGVIQYMGYQCFPSNWNDFLEVLLKFVNFQMPQIRQVASQAVGIYIMLTPQQHRSLPVAMRVLRSLRSALGMPRRKDEGQQSYLYAKDSIIAAMGRVVRIFIDAPGIRPALGVWLANMPIKYDRKQTQKQTQYLLEIIIGRPQLLYNIKQLFRVLTDIVVMKSLMPEDERKKLKYCIQMVIKLKPQLFRNMVGSEKYNCLTQFLKQ